MSSPIYQNPLAYLLGLEGVALLRGFAGDLDESFTRDRLADVRRLLDDPVLVTSPGVSVYRGTALDGYRQWAPSYDEPNGLFDYDEPFVYGIVDGLAPRVALDAACGTGRFARGLIERGHRVIGVDASPDMLAVARERLPDADLRVGALDDLPVDDDSVDLVVSALAVSHVPDLAPVMAEFARVVRPGGHVIVSDVHHELVLRGSVVVSPREDGEPALVPTYRHTPGDFLRAALPAGLRVLRCEEPGNTTNPPETDTAESGQEDADAERSTILGPWTDWPWSLLDRIPAAARDASWHIPFVIDWHFQREN